MRAQATREERLDALASEIEAMKSYGRFPERLGVRQAFKLGEMIDEFYRITQEYAVAVRAAERRSDVAIRAVGDRVRVANERTERARNARKRAEARAEKAEAKAEELAFKALQAGVADFDPHGYFVYILWGDEAPLYVGQSSNILSRLGTHLGDGKKRPHVRRVAVARCTTKQDMDALEKRLIREHRPPWNRVGYTKITDSALTFA